MGWFNYYGLAIIVLILIPNVVHAVICRGEMNNGGQNKALEIAEQIGRYACMAFMVFNIPYSYFGFWFVNAFTVYLTVNGVLCLGYLIFWAVFKGGKRLAGALSLSITPSVIFLFSGVILLSIPLIVSAVVFAVCHIRISIINAKK